MQRIMKKVRQHLPKGLGAGGATKITQFGVTQDTARASSPPVRTVAGGNSAFAVLRMAVITQPTRGQVGEIITVQLCHEGSLLDEGRSGDGSFCPNDWCDTSAAIPNLHPPALAATLHRSFFQKATERAGARSMTHS